MMTVMEPVLVMETVQMMTWPWKWYKNGYIDMEMKT